MANKVVIRSKVGAAGFNIGERLKVEFTEKNNFTAQVPREVTWRDDFGKIKSLGFDPAAHLLKTYPYLEAVSEIEDKLAPVAPLAPVVPAAEPQTVSQ